MIRQPHLAADARFEEAMFIDHAFSCIEPQMINGTTHDATLNLAALLQSWPGLSETPKAHEEDGEP